MKLTLDFEITFEMLAAINDIIESDSEDRESYIQIKELGPGEAGFSDDKMVQIFNGITISAHPKPPEKLIKLLDLIKQYTNNSCSIAQAS